MLYADWAIARKLTYLQGKHARRFEHVTPACLVDVVVDCSCAVCLVPYHDMSDVQNMLAQCLNLVLGNSVRWAIIGQMGP